MKHAWAFGLFCGLFFSQKIYGQQARDWDATLGSPNWDELHVTIPTPDGGYLIGGNATANGHEVSGEAFGLNDFWLLKTDGQGKKIWDKTFGGSSNDRMWDILPLPDGGFLLGGTSDSEISGSKTAQNFGKEDFWVIKISAEGQEIWEKTFGGSQRDELFSLEIFPDKKSVLLGGWSNSGADGMKTSDSLGVFDVWVLKMDLATGEIVWQTLLGGEALDNLYDVASTADGGFLLGGASASNISPTKSQNCRGYSDFWVVKIDTAGHEIWDRRFGGTDVEQLEQILPLSDGNFLLAGASMSPKSGDKLASNFGSFDMWAVKITPDGERIWDKSYGGGSFDGAYQVVETPAGNLIFGGTSASSPGGSKESPAYGNYDFWLNYTDAAGNLFWEKSYGGSKSDALTGLVQSPDGSLLLTGHSESPKSAFKSENPRGYNDFWLLKTYCNVDFSLPADTSFCSGKPFELAVFPKNCAGGDCEMIWNDGQTGNEISFLPDSSGVLAVEATDQNACRATDTLKYQILESPIVALPADTVIFETGSQLYLDAFQKDAVFEWSTGHSTPFIIVEKTANYAVTVTAANGCTASDDIEVCACGKRLLYIPNVFQPNEDIFNDIWYIQCKPGAVEILEKVQVVDKWGHLVYQAKNIQANDKTVGWEGFSGGTRCLPDVYTYIIEVLYENNVRERLFGTVTLLR